MQPASDRAHSMRMILPGDQKPGETYHLLSSLVVPRPIAWVSTVAPDGTANLAPHSYFMAVASDPPAIAFSSIGVKDTILNLRVTPEFVVHIVDKTHAERMNTTSAEAPRNVSEFDLAALKSIPARSVAAPIIDGVPIAIECRVLQEFPVGNGNLVIGECLAFHVAERLWDANERVDPGRLDAVARMGGSTYATTRDRFTLRRPTYEDVLRTD